MPQIVKSSFHVETEVDGTKILREMELFARNCYKSEGKTGDFEQTKSFVGKLLHTFKHEGIGDHHVISVRFIFDRGILAEATRHRVAAYLVESTRYVDYHKAGEIQVIDIAPHLTEEQLAEWWEAMADAERHYNNLRAMGLKPELARSVLPHSLKTEAIATLNLTSWRNFFKKRACNVGAHPQFREVAIPLLLEFQKLIPVVFDDLVPAPMPWVKE